MEAEGAADAETEGQKSGMACCGFAENMLQLPQLDQPASNMTRSKLK